MISVNGGTSKLHHPPPNKNEYMIDVVFKPICGLSRILMPRVRILETRARKRTPSAGEESSLGAPRGVEAPKDCNL